MTCDEDGTLASVMMSEVTRILRRGGHYICISHSGPGERTALLQLCHDSEDEGKPAPSQLFDLVSNKQIRNGQAIYHVYVMRRR